MSAERRKVLEMLSAGTITPEDAELLLDRLAPSAAAERAPEAGGAGGAEGEESEERSRPLRFLRIVVESPVRDSVNISLPLGLVRTGLKLSTLMPERVSERLSERGIDLSRLDDEALLAELAAVPIEIAAEDGEKIRIFCE